MKTKLTTLIVILFFANQLVCGQVDDEAPKITPPTPTAFELGKYGQMNVGLFTGTASIDIPLYTFKTKSLNVPISLNYSSNGIKVDQMETNVGLGWNLNAGGVITRIIRDQPDEDNYAFYPKNTISNLSDPFTLEYFYNAGQGINDTETDIYMYNFNGYSGKFVYGNDKSIVSIPASPLLILPIGGDITDGFIIVTPDGNKYFFSEPEYTTTRIEGGGTHSEPTNTLTSWYLSKIETPNSKEIVNFEYTGCGYSYYAGITQTFKIPFPDWQYECNQATLRSVGTLSTTKTRITQSAKILTRVSSNQSIDGSVTFTSGALLPGTTGYKMLSKMTVLNATNDTIEKFGFNYIQTTKNRVFLSELTTKDTNKKYSFNYNTPEQFPERLSFSQDHWGYFNNQNNSYLIPKPENNDAFVSLTTFGNRELNATASMIGLLNKVTYPTKGYTELVYEGNSYPGTKTTNTDTKKTVNIQSAIGSEYEGSMNAIQTATLTIPFKQIVQIWVNARYDTSGDCYNMDNPKPAGAFFSIKNNTNNNYAKTYYKSYYGTDVYLDLSKFTTSNNSIAYYALLDAGTYTVSIRASFACMIGVVNISYISDRVTSTVQTAIPEAGVRLKYLNTYDPTTNKTEIKRYYYARHNALNQSTGVKLKTPQYVSNLQIHKVCQTDLAPIGINYKILNSSSLVSVYNISGVNSTMYQYVTVSHGGDNFEYGGEEHQFIINEDIDPYSARGDYILNTPTTNTGWNNGMEEETQTFKKGSSGEHIMLSKTTNHYITDNRLHKEVNAYSIRKNYEEPLLTAPTYTCTAEDAVKTYTEYKCIANHNHCFFLCPNFDALAEYINAIGILEVIVGEAAFHGKTVCIASGANNVADIKYGPCYGKSGQTITNSNSINNLDIMSYKNISYWFYQNSKTTTVYDINGQNPITTTENYYYDNPAHLQLTRKEAIGSDNKTNKEQIYYAYDLALTDLSNQYRISEPVKVENYVSNVLTKTKQTDYINWGDNLIQPQYIKTALGANVLENAIQFISYDNLNGNVTELTGKDNVHVVYLWGYNGKYPIAEIKNATLADVTSALTGTTPEVLSSSISPDITKVEALRTSSKLPIAQITTFIYQPLVGIASKTDSRGVTTFYNYDSFNRLQNIKDKDGKIIQSFEYNYKH